MEVIVHETPREASAAVAVSIADAISGKQGRFSWGLAGGSTPARTYRHLRDAPVDWSKVDGWLADERWVPRDSDRCNGRMVARLLFDRVPARLYQPEWGEDLSPHDSALRYEAVLKTLHEDSADLVFLGLGDDGHTASLFPGSPALSETGRQFVENTIPDSGEIRLTATFPLLHAAQQIIFLVFGESKAEALRDSLRGETPAGLVNEGSARVEWHVDQLAASLL
ncbi:MAG TPA: 6-phosphogluconolactonase [Acidimicrobiia bacterium]